MYCKNVNSQTGLNIRGKKKETITAKFIVNICNIGPLEDIHQEEIISCKSGDPNEL